MITFKDLKFVKRDMGGIGINHSFDNGISISIQAGKFPYSTPRENLDSVDDYSSFEVAIFNELEGGRFATKDFVPSANDDVLGWQDRGQINTLMLMIQNQ